MTMVDASGNGLDRRSALPALVGDPADLLVVSGLAGASKDAAALTHDGPNGFTMAGAMGAAVSIGLGLALARPTHRVLVVTGDGELLMNVGALATVALAAPSNLAIVCLDNGHYGETGNQLSHTASVTDLAAMARGAGIERTVEASTEEELAAASELVRASGPTFILVRVNEAPPASFVRNLRADECRIAFRQALTASTARS